MQGVYGSLKVIHLAHLAEQHLTPANMVDRIEQPNLPPRLVDLIEQHNLPHQLVKSTTLLNHHAERTTLMLPVLGTSP